MQIKKTPKRYLLDDEEGAPAGDLYLWDRGESDDHPAGINFWLRTPSGKIYEAQFSTDEILSLLPAR